MTGYPIRSAVASASATFLSRLPHGGTGALFHPHQTDHFRARPDELNAGKLAHLGEARVLAQEAVAGVDGVNVRDLRRADDRRNVQVAPRALGRTDADRLIGEADVQTVAVRLRVDRHGPDAQLLAGTNDTERDLAAIGDQDFLKEA